MKKTIIIFLLFIFNVIFVTSIMAQSTTSAPKTDNGSELIRQGIVDTGTTADLGNETSDFRIVIAKIINIALSFLGTIFTLLIIYGGFTWMTAGGNEENVSRAKKIISQATIGLLIVILAYGLSNLIFNIIRGGTDPNL